MSDQYDVYSIRPGDQLYAIMRKQYGDARFFARRDALLSSIMNANPHITDKDQIRAGSTLALPVFAASEPVEAIEVASERQRAANQMLCRAVSNTPQSTRDVLYGMQALNAAADELDRYSPVFNSASGVYDGLGTLAKQARDAYQNKARDLQFIQALVKNEKIKSSSYYEHRRKIIDATDQKFSIIRDRFGRDVKPTSKVLRISQNNARLSKSVDKALTFADSLGTRAKVGGRALGVLSAGIGAARYATQTDAKTRSVIVMETAGAALLGAATGTVSVALTAALVSNPAGWTVIVGALVVSTVLGSAGGSLGRVAGEALHDAYGSRDKDIIEALFD